ncbi:hypothetical protein AGMMS50276_32970 [Synergistales bacterium]|nr:hypothetical protein AGMMS50276_32970 [Synergistales bacterium]
MNNNIITLYHGSIYSFDEIDLTRGKPFKDFGSGFYTTQNREHALNLAYRNREIRLARLEIEGLSLDVNMWLYTYEFPVELFDNLSVKKFDEPNREWMQFVGENRMNKKARHDFDIVIGPTANDRTNLSIKTYFFGGYGGVGSDIAIDILLQVIKPYELPPQIFFGSEKAVKCLTLKRKEMIR